MRTLFITIITSLFCFSAFAQSSVSVTGIAYNEDAAPIAEQTIELWYDSCGVYNTLETFTDENGVYAFDFQACASGFVLVYATCINDENAEQVETMGNFYQGNYELTLNIYNLCPSDTSCTTAFQYEKIDSNGLYNFTASTIGGNQNFDCQWLVNGDTFIGENLSYSFENSGNYTINLTAIDDNGVTCTYAETIEVLVALQGCEYDWQRDSTTGAFNFQAQTTAGVAPITYEWHFGDGNFSTSATPQYTFSDTGTYMVCLYLIDGLDTYCNSCKTISVGTLETAINEEEQEENPDDSLIVEEPIVENCLDNELLDLSATLSEEFAVVCGCDGVSYQNADIAEKGYGIAVHEPFSCESNATLFHFNIKRFGENQYTLSTKALDGQVYNWSVTGEDTIFNKNKMAITFEEELSVFSKKVCMFINGVQHCKTLVFEANPQGVISGKLSLGNQDDLPLNAVYQIGDLPGTESLANTLVYLEDINGNSIAQTYTDEEGNYYFEHLNFGFFNIKVGIAQEITQLNYSLNLKPERKIYTDFNLLLSLENENSTSLTDIAFDENDIKLFPNPARERIQISHPFNEDLLQVQVLNMLGQVQFKETYRNANNNDLFLDISRLANGTYQVELACNKGHYTLPFIKR